MTLTPEEYIDEGAVVCPNCESELLETGDPYVDGLDMFHPVNCEDCGASWTDVYTMRTYISLEVPGEETQWEPVRPVDYVNITLNISGQNSELPRQDP